MKQKIKNPGKKMNPIIIVVIAVVIIGALYYGATRWRQQQYVNQLKKLYGGDTSLLGKLTGGNNGLSDQLIKEMAKEDAKQKEDDAKEAAKTPQDRFNETKEVTLTGNTASALKEVIEPQLTAVFGKIKPTLFTGNYMNQGNSFLVVFKVSKQPTSEDMNKLVAEMTKSGYTDTMSSIGADSANLLMEKNGNNISISYENPEEQEIGVLYIDQSANN